MEIRVKLMGVLRDKTPEGGVLQMSENGTIRDALETLEIPLEIAQTFTVNGQLSRDQSLVLSDSDELTVLPPVGGG